MLRIAIVALGGVLLLSASGAFSDTAKVSLASHTYCIPSTFNLLDQTTKSAFDLSGGDKTSGGSFQIALPAEYINERLPEYEIAHGDMPATIFIGLKQTSEHRINHSQAAQLRSDLLRLKGDYANADIEPVGSGDLVRVTTYGLPNPPVWHVLKVEPRRDATIPDTIHDYHVAYCGRSGSSSSNCEFEIPYQGQTLLRIVTTENNLALKPQLITEANQILAEWQSNCSNR